MQIEKVWAREVLDSRGNPTVEAELTVKGHKIRAIAPSGASTGTWEAHELRDGGARYGGKGVLKAVENIRGEIANRITGMDPTDLRAIDEAMIELDGTENKSRLGGTPPSRYLWPLPRREPCARGFRFTSTSETTMSPSPFPCSTSSTAENTPEEI